MQNRSARTWGIHIGVTACIAVAGVVGAALPAGAAVTTTVPARSVTTISAPTTNATTSSASGPAVPPGGSSSTNLVSSPVSQTAVDGETRSWASIIRTAINALKKVPALWKKVADGVKRSLSWFKANVWPAIKATVNLVSGLLTAQEIWKFFN